MEGCSGTSYACVYLKISKEISAYLWQSRRHSTLDFTGYLIDVFSIHIIIRVSLFLEKVFRSRKSVFIKQLASIFPYLVRLAFTFLLKAFYMTVIRFRQRVISKAVSLHSQIFHSRFTNTSSALFASSLTVCG